MTHYPGVVNVANQLAADAAVFATPSRRLMMGRACEPSPTGAATIVRVSTFEASN